MKNSKFKKGISLFLTVLMLLSCWVFVPGEHQHTASALSKTINLSALAAISNGSGDRASNGKIVVCSDGRDGNTTVGVLKFPISGLPTMVTKATFNVNIGNHGGYIPSHAKFYLVDPSKCTDATAVVQTISKISTVYNNNYSSTTGASNAYNYFGITESQALDTVYQNLTGIRTFDVTNAVNTAKANGWTDLCLVFIMPQAFSDNGSTGWSDLHIYSSNTNLYVEYEGAYGMPQASYDDNRTGKITAHPRTDGVDYADMYYPTEIYLDKSENLEDAGYKIYLSGHYAASDDYRTLVFSTAWGGSYDRDNGALKNQTMLEMFDNYTYYTTDEVNVTNGKDNYSVDGTNWVINFKGASTDFSATVNLQGTPNAGKVGTEATFDSCNNNTDTPLVVYMQKWNWPGNWNDSAGAWMNASEVTGQVKIKVTLYDKEALNQTYQKAVKIFEMNSANGALIKEGLEEFDNRYGYTKTGSSLTLLKTRKTNQTEIDNETTALENAIKGMKAYASNDALKTAITNAESILNDASYNNKYTQTTRTALEAAYNNAKNSGYHNSVPVYQVGNINDSSTWDFTSKAVADQAAIDNLTNLLNTAISAMEIQKYSVTFNFANNTSNTQTYNYGAAITAPSNSTKEADASNHYTYTWSPSVSTTVTNNATYSEVLTTEEHKWGNWDTVLSADCKTEGKERRSCSVCSYVEERNLGKDNTVHNHTTTVAQTNATCTTDGYTAGDWCYDCETWISGHEIIPAAHTPGAAATCTAPQTCTVCGEELAAQLAHTEATREENRIEPTCGQAGSYVLVTYCSVCNTEIKREDKTIPATGKHTEATREENRNEPTCGADGSYVLVTYCSVCNTEISRENKTISATGNHSWNNGEETKAPTCIATGIKTYTCTVCGETKEEAISATGNHVYGKWAQYNNGTTHRRYCEADTNCTAFEEGTHEFTSEVLLQIEGSNYHQYKCNKCDEAYGVGTTMNVREACFGDGTAFAPIADNDNEHGETCKCGREKTDSHSYGKWFADPENSTDKNGKMSRICSECSYKQTSACTYKVIDSKEATCTENGYKIWKCKDADCVNTYTETFAAAGHSPAAAVKEDIIQASCIDNGSYNAVVYCSVAECGEKISSTATTIEKREHKMGSWQVVTPATYFADGEEIRYCQNTTPTELYIACTHSETQAIPMLTDSTAPTGTITYGVSVWDKLLETISFNTYINYDVDVVITAEDSESDIAKIEYYISDKAIDTEDIASWTEYTDKVSIPKADAEKKVIYAKLTNTQGKVSYISTDGFVFDITNPVIDVQTTCTAATITVTEANLSFVTSNGSEITLEDGKYEFTESGEYEIVATDKAGNTVKETVKIEGHKYDKVVTDPTCTEDGFTTYTCSVCGDSYVDDEVEALGHSFTNYESDGNATCTQDGTKTAKCDRCDATDTIIDEGSSSIQHNYVATEVEATCTEKGSVTYTCSLCGDTYTDEEVPALGHSFTNYINNNNATCTDKATKTAKCDRCDATDTKVIEGSRLPHVPGGAVKENEIPATCRDKGSYERVYYCSGCGIKLNIEYVTVPTTNNHDMVVVPEKAPTCDENGHSEYIACTVCGYSRGKEVYPATGHLDEDGDHICDSCDFDYTFNCVCICHSDNKFIRFIYIVFRIFWKLFNIHKGCYCGIDHF